MTTTEFEGLRVIAEDDATTPLTTKKSGPIRLKQVRELLLEDGSTAYGCLHCDYASRNMNSIRPHLRIHAGHRRHPNGSLVARTSAAPVPVGAAVAPATSPGDGDDDAIGREFPGVAEFLRAMSTRRDDTAWKEERAELVAYHEQRYDKIVAERDDWKKRAKTAERMLSRLNDALASVDTSGAA